MLHVPSNQECHPLFLLFLELGSEIKLICNVRECLRCAENTHMCNLVALTFNKQNNLCSYIKASNKRFVLPFNVIVVIFILN